MELSINPEPLERLPGNKRTNADQDTVLDRKERFVCLGCATNDASCDPWATNHSVNLPSGTRTTDHLVASNTHLNCHCLSATRFAYTTESHDTNLQLTERVAGTHVPRCPIYIHISCQPYMAPYIFFTTTENGPKHTPKSLIYKVI